MSKATLRSWSTLAFVLALVVAVSGGAVGAATTLSPTDERVAAGETTTVELTLSAAPNGVAGFELRLELPDTDRVEVVDADVNERFGVNESAVLGDGSGARFKAADIHERVQAGSENVTLASVTLSGVSPGEVTVGIDLASVDDDNGNSMNPSLETASVTVRDSDSGDDQGDDKPDPTSAASDTPTPDSSTASPDAPSTTTPDGPSTPTDSVTPTETAPETETANQTTTQPATEPATDNVSGTDSPGFGATVALVALVGTLLALGRRT